MGFPLEIFLESVQSNYICVICKQVLEEPVYCNSCQTYYCFKCINPSPLQTPITKKKPLIRAQVCAIGNSQIKRAPHKQYCMLYNAHEFSKPEHAKLLYMNIKALPIKCKNENCSILCTLGSLENHLEKECEVNAIKCSHVGCMELFIRSELDKHQEDCYYKKINCQICSEVYKKGEGHNCINNLLKMNIHLKNKNFELKQAQGQHSTQINILRSLINNLINEQIRREKLNDIVNFDPSHTHPSITLSENFKSATWNESLKPSALLNIAIQSGKIYRFTFLLGTAIGYFVGISHRLSDYSELFTDKGGYAYSNVHQKLIENGKSGKSYGQIVSGKQEIEMVINSSLGTVQYILDQKHYGVAFNNIDFNDLSNKWYIALSAISNTHTIELTHASVIHLF